MEARDLRGTCSPRRLQASAVPCQPIIVTAGRLPVHDSLRKNKRAKNNNIFENRHLQIIPTPPPESAVPLLLGTIIYNGRPIIITVRTEVHKVFTLTSKAANIRKKVILRGHARKITNKTTLMAMCCCVVSHFCEIFAGFVNFGTNLRDSLQQNATAVPRLLQDKQTNMRSGGLMGQEWTVGAVPSPTLSASRPQIPMRIGIGIEMQSTRQPWHRAYSI